MMSIFLQTGIIFLIVFKTVCLIAGENYDILVPKVGGIQNKIICQGQSGNLSCANESMVMVIYTASYGRAQGGDTICGYNPLVESQDRDDKTIGCKTNVINIVRKLCHKLTICDVPVKKELMGRPCKGVYKYLKIIYGCGLPVYVLKPTPNTTSNATIDRTRNTTSNASYTTVTPVTAPNATVILPVATAIRRRTPVKRTNETSYVAVFVVAALCAAVLFGIVFGRCWYLKRRTKSTNFAVLHKPKRFFDPRHDYKQSNGHSGRRASRDHANEELLPERALSKTEVVITRAEVETTQPSRPSRTEADSSSTSARPKPGSAATDEGDGTKPDNSTFYVNPMYDRNRQNSAGSAISAGSHPRIPPAHRLSNASEGKASTMSSPGRTLNKQQMRCNSMGNLPRSGGHHSIQRRHPSAGNVASNKDGLCVEPLTYPPKGAHHPQQQGHLYNSPYQGQGQGHGNYQGQGDYQGQKRQSPGTPGRGGPGGYTKSPMTPRPGMTGQPMGSPAKAPQRNRPVGPGGVPYQSPGPPGRTGNRPNSPYEYGTTENGIDANRRYHGNDTPQWESNPSHNSNGPTHARSNGRLHRRESYENIQPFDNLPDPLVHEDTKLNGRVYQAQPPGGENTVGPLSSIKMKMEALFT